jgi:hypothetical protein
VRELSAIRASAQSGTAGTQVFYRVFEIAAVWKGVFYRVFEVAAVWKGVFYAAFKVAAVPFACAQPVGNALFLRP